MSDVEIPHNHPLHEYLVKKEDTDVIIHHIGDGQYAGNPKFRFNSLVEGSIYRKPFKIDVDGINLSKAVFKIEHRGIQLINNPIYINNTVIGHLPVSPTDGTFLAFELEIDVSLFKKGLNEFKIESAYDVKGNFDDFEFKNCKIDFEKADHECPVIESEPVCHGGPGGEYEFLGSDIDVSLDVDLINDCGDTVGPDGSVIPTSGSTDGDVFSNPKVVVAAGRRPTNQGDNQAIRDLAPEIETRDTDSDEYIDNWGGW
jgi:hypothetical protein